METGTRRWGDCRRLVRDFWCLRRRERGPGRRAPVAGRGALVLDARDRRPEGLELRLDLLVAAIDVIDAVDLGRPLGDEAGEHERRARTEVARHDGSPREPGHAPDDRARALLVDVG